MVHAVGAASRREPLAVKVPRITALFWVVKLLTTAGGEAVSDYLANRGHLIAGVVEIAVFVPAVLIQFRTRRYIAAAYWYLALAIAIFGTGVSDALHLIVGIPYGGTTALWTIVLAAIFWLWHRSEGTLSIHSIVTRRREVYYWSVVFATFALGTALGDFTASVLKLGYFSSGVLFTVVIMIPLVAWRRFNMNPVLAFWFAYVVTRPMGASFADYLSKPHDLSGADLGDARVAGAFLLVLAVLVGYLAVSRSDIQPPEEQDMPDRYAATPAEPGAADLPVRGEYL